MKSESRISKLETEGTKIEDDLNEFFRGNHPPLPKNILERKWFMTFEFFLRAMRFSNQWGDRELNQ